MTVKSNSGKTLFKGKLIMNQRKSSSKSKKTLTQRVNALEKELCNLKKGKQTKASVLPEPKAGMIFRDSLFGKVYIIINNCDGDGTHRLENVEDGITWSGNAVNVCSREIYGDQGEDRLLYLGMLSEFKKPLNEKKKLKKNLKKASYTFNEWKKSGRHIRPGERHTGRNENGEATFTFYQTESALVRQTRINDFNSDCEGCCYDEFWKD
jgi:hypothetical protein